MKKKALPPKVIIGLGKFIWTQMWQIMMSNLAPRSSKGEYIRPESQFRNIIDDSYPPVAGRYELIAGLSCPWAHRTLIVRTLKGLEAAISVNLVSPSPLEGGWIFDTPLEQCRTLAQFYQLAKPDYTGRNTVPVLWDKQTKTIVNNESAEIIVILNSAFNEFATKPELDLYPQDLKEQIDRWNEKIYPAVNNGVYRCGLAQSQEAYDRAFEELFNTFNELDLILGNSTYLCGDRLTLADIRLFTTLFRFDIAYYSLFKCNWRRIQDYQFLHRYLRDIYQLPGVADTCNLEAIKKDYFGNLFPLNPGGIIPKGPDLTNLL
jgi:putative glutathione S-transferase